MLLVMLMLCLSGCHIGLSVLLLVLVSLSIWFCSGMGLLSVCALLVVYCDPVVGM